MFVGRREDGTIYGLWTVRQWKGQEELPDDHADVVAFVKAQESILQAASNLGSVERGSI